MCTQAVSEWSGAISPEARAAVDSLCYVAQRFGVHLYLVGGVVRDRLLRGAAPAAGPPDLDIAVEGEVEALLAALPSARWHVYDRFGSASGRLGDGSRIDLVRTRSERYPSPAALPIVESAPIEADLLRRDFTINAAAFGLTGPLAGSLLDPRGAAGDAERRLLRVLHDGSFRDDPTRLIRLCRYAARIGGRAERRTARLAREASGGLAQLTPARFGDAWRALLEDTAAEGALRGARRRRLPQARLPGWEISARAASVVGDGRGDAAPRCWAAVGLTCADRSVVERLPTAAALRRGERVALDGGAALRAAKGRIGRARRLSEAAALTASIPDSALEAAVRLWGGRAGERVREIAARRGGVRSPLSGAELLALGVPAGPLVGAWRRRLEGAVWDGELGCGEDAHIAAAKEWVRLSPNEVRALSSEGEP